MWFSVSKCETNRSRFLDDKPSVMERSSSSEWSSSGKVWARGSSKTVMASRKEIPCLRRFAAALAGSNSKVRRGRSYVGGRCHSSAAQLAEIEFFAGLSLVWPQLDVDHYLPHLLEGRYGDERWMEALRRRGSRLRAERCGVTPTSQNRDMGHLVLWRVSEVGH